MYSILEYQKRGNLEFLAQFCLLVTHWWVISSNFYPFSSSMLQNRKGKHTIIPHLHIYTNYLDSWDPNEWKKKRETRFIKWYTSLMAYTKIMFTSSRINSKKVEGWLPPFELLTTWTLWVNNRMFFLYEFKTHPLFYSMLRNQSVIFKSNYVLQKFTKRKIHR